MIVDLTELTSRRLAQSDTAQVTPAELAALVSVAREAHALYHRTKRHHGMAASFGFDLGPLGVALERVRP